MLPKKIWIAIILIGFVFIVGVFFYIAVGSNSSKSTIFDPQLSSASQTELKRLPFCEVSKKTKVPATIIAGVVVAEKQLNRDWSDFIQDSLFSVGYYLFDQAWWQKWSDRAMNLASSNLASRTTSSEWSKDVSWTGIIFSIGPSQITTRTALQACELRGQELEWCNGTKRLVKALLSEQESLEVASLILDVERQIHMQKTGVDIALDYGKWATLYNFGGDIFRARFKNDPNRGPNGFGKWVGNNANQIELILNCQK